VALEGKRRLQHSAGDIAPDRSLGIPDILIDRVERRKFFAQHFHILESGAEAQDREPQGRGAAYHFGFGCKIHGVAGSIWPSTVSSLG
jgi:hypothetical protein